MSQEIEIEYKTLLTKEEFEEIKKSLPFPTHAVEQTNYYFETRQFHLKENRSALRIREKEGGYTLTLKEPHAEGILETHDSLLEEEFLNWINGKPIKKPNVAEQLRRLGVEMNDLVYFGSLKTERTTFEKHGILYMLDKSYYHGKVDYELEIEATTREEGWKAFTTILQRFDIPKRDSITKIERFFQEKR